MTYTTQTCAKCKIEKPLHAFHRRFDRPRKKHYTCRSCISQGTRKPLPALPKLSERQWGWLAGMLDGEGSVSFGYSGSGIPRYLTLRIYNCHLGCLEWLRDKVGGTIHSVGRKSARHREAFVWNISMRSAYGLIREILPDLKIKSRHAEVAIAFCERVWSAKNEARDNGSGIMVDYDDVLAALSAELTALNRRGPRSDPSSPLNDARYSHRNTPR